MKKTEIEFCCDYCGKSIPKGKAYVSLIRNVEQIEHEVTTNEEEIQVIDSVELLTLCGKCGNNFDSETLIHIIKNIPLIGKRKNN